MVFSQNTQTYYHIGETLLEMLVSYPSHIPEYLALLHSRIPEIFFEPLLHVIGVSPVLFIRTAEPRA